MLLRMSDPENRAPIGRIERMYMSLCSINTRDGQHGDGPARRSLGVSSGEDSR